MERLTIMGVPFLKIDQQNFVKLMLKRIENKEKTFVVTANPEIVMAANENPELMAYIDKSTYVTADGIGVVKAAKILGDELPGRVTGFDTVMALFASQTPMKVYLLGAQQETLDQTVANIHRDFPHIDIVGAHNGFFDWDKNTIAEDMLAAKPDLILVALGVPRQEKWISTQIDKFEHGVFIGVGGTFDAIAGTMKRAPLIWQKLNLEWLYRVAGHPSRWKRALALPKFALKVFGLKLKGQGLK